jgi:hypothetical protein
MIIPPWSYSSLTKYETCPKQYQILRVTKQAKDSQGEAAIWGDKVHRAIEQRIISKTPLPEGMQQWERIVCKFDKPKGRVFTETRFSLTRNMQPCTWGDKQCWVRGIIDVGVDAGKRVVALDWKTGKIKPEMSQLELFAALIMQSKPYVQEVKTGYVWLVHNKMTKQLFTREDLPRIWDDFNQRVARLDASYMSDKWIPKPSGLCKGWCAVPRSLCEFSGRN